MNAHRNVYETEWSPLPRVTWQYFQTWFWNQKIELQCADILCPCNCTLIEIKRDCRQLLSLPFTTCRMNYTVPYCAFLLAMGDGKKSSLILKVCHGNSAAFPCRVFQAEITLCFEMFSGVFFWISIFFPATVHWRTCGEQHTHLLFATTSCFLETVPSKHFWRDRQRVCNNQGILTEMQTNLDSKNCLLVIISDDIWKDLEQI